MAAVPILCRVCHGRWFQGRYCFDCGAAVWGENYKRIMPIPETPIDGESHD